jgi:hypothetical protein
MCEQIDLPKEKATSRRRRKLWEIGEGHHCSVLGTCLRRTDLRKFARKKMFQVEAGANDYKVHLALVGIAKSRNPKSRALHKFLDERYRAAVKRYASAQDDEEALQLWDQDVKRGAVAGAYWAIVTNQLFSSETQTEVYGQNHMMSHDIVGSDQHEKRLNEEIVNKAALLEEVLVSERQFHLKEQMAMAEEIENLKKTEDINILLTTENKKIIEKNERLQSELAGTSLSGKMEKFKDQLKDSNKRNARLCAEIDSLKRALEESGDLFDLASNTTEELTVENGKLEKSLAVLQQEVLSMESTILGDLNASSSCTTCGDQNTNRCPGTDLCGKTILYVGGLHKMVSHYRQVVENHGGKFLHHDGGKEASRAMLPKMLSTADAVLCPIDCVSHDACTCVKKICKRYQKPYVMMRSSGLSSLAKGLTEIVQ